MTHYDYRPVANGLRTDHPIPDLPFVDDSHIPVEDPHGIEAVGRNREEGMWGRQDRARYGGDGWIAFTTDPDRHDLAWCVRWHPEHGRSVVLFRDEDSSGVHMSWLTGPALLFRAGGYWWDGTIWYRPSQIWDAATETYFQRPVPAAVTVTAADTLTDRGDPDRGHVLAVQDIDLTTDPATPAWLDDLARWARDRQPETLAAAVITVSAPELTGDQLLGIADMATIAGIAPATLRAYISRGDGQVPLPQATVNGRNVWSRRVAEEWAEYRRRSDGVGESLASKEGLGSMPIGKAEIRDRFGRMFHHDLWENPQLRRRWALRSRNETAVQEVADNLGWVVAESLDRIIPLTNLAIVIRQAVLRELAISQQLHRAGGQGEGIPVIGNDHDYTLLQQVTTMLDWLIQHDPDLARHTIGEIVGEANRSLDIPRDITERSLRGSLILDSKLDKTTLRDYLDRVLTPEQDAG